jgi:hypothetical protein
VLTISDSQSCPCRPNHGNTVRHHEDRTACCEHLYPSSSTTPQQNLIGDNLHVIILERMRVLTSFRYNVVLRSCRSACAQTLVKSHSFPSCFIRRCHENSRFTALCMAISCSHVSWSLVPQFKVLLDSIYKVRQHYLPHRPVLLRDRVALTFVHHTVEKAQLRVRAKKKSKYLRPVYNFTSSLHVFFACRPLYDNCFFAVHTWLLLLFTVALAWTYIGYHD